MDDTFGVGQGERVSELRHHEFDLTNRHRAAAFDAVGEVLTPQQLHYQVGRRGGLIDPSAHDLDYVIAIDCAGGLRFSHEALANIGMIRQAWCE